MMATLTSGADAAALLPCLVDTARQDRRRLEGVFAIVGVMMPPSWIETDPVTSPDHPSEDGLVGNHRSLCLASCLQRKDTRLESLRWGSDVTHKKLRGTKIRGDGHNDHVTGTSKSQPPPKN